MKVIHLNVRLNEGGAAAVARRLHTELNRRQAGTSIFYYGYGKGGKVRAIDLETEQAHPLMTRARAGANLLYFKYFNKDVVPPGKRRLSEFFDDVARADVLHVHVVHSYFMPLRTLSALFAACKRNNVAVVWTLHDHWVLTGRCAFLDGCDRWQWGCGMCVTLDNYPQVSRDDSATMFAEKRRFFAAHAGDISFVAPSRHLADQVRMGLGVPVTVIPNPSAVDFECVERSEYAAQTRVLVIAHDLSYQGKTDREWVGAFETTPGIKLTTVGGNSPFRAAVNLGYVDSKELASIYAEIDVMLFTSSVDNFPGVVVESLLLGVPVVAKDSPAARELLSLVGGVPVTSLEEALNLCAQRNVLTVLYAGQTTAEIKERAEAVFSLDAHVNAYLKLYSRSETSFEASWRTVS